MGAAQLEREEQGSARAGSVKYFLRY